jgi:hypothetical protein
VSFFINHAPKNRRYVLATRDGPADLIIENKRGAAFPITRLQRFENSRYARMLKDHAEEEQTAVQRKKEKKAKIKTVRDIAGGDGPITRVSLQGARTLSLGESKHVNRTTKRKRTRRSTTSTENPRTNARTRKAKISKSRSRH